MRFSIKESGTAWAVYDEKYGAVSGKVYNNKKDAERMAKLFNARYPEKKKGKKKS